MPTIQQIIEGFGDRGQPEKFAASMGKLEPTTEIIRKQVPGRLLRFEEDEPAMVGVTSDIRKDRDKEVLLPEGMDDSTESGVVSWNHDYWREGVPHARTLWNKLDPKANPYQVLSKTLYLVELSPLGKSVYEYRKKLNPLGQSVGFRSVESVRKGDSGYDEVFKAWLPRVKAMLKEKKIKPTADEFTEPLRFFTKWEKWEHGDVFIGSNVDAIQIAVNKGVLTPGEAKELVEFKGVAEPDGGMGEINELRDQIAELEAEIQELKADKDAPPSLTLRQMWDEPTLKELWDKTTAM